MNWNFVNSRLATGGALGSPGDALLLKAAGITHVIDCRIEFDDAPLLSGAGMAYLWNGTADDGTPKPPEWFDTSLKFALPALAVPGHKIYCHCAAGINRGPSTAYAILRALGLSDKLAWGEVVIHRPECIAGVRYRADADKAVQQLGYC